MRSLLISFSLTLLLFACNSRNLSDNNSSENQVKKTNDYQMMAILYNYYAAEYKALAYQAFNTAKERLQLIRVKEPGRKNLAVVVDIDETILDNSPYQAKLLELNTTYDSCWNTWCNLASARAVPGAVEFLQYADSLGFNIFYVSNRKKTLEDATAKNLQNLGFPQVSDDHFYLRTTGSGKEARRNTIAEKYDIVLLAGDNLGDFFSDTREYSKRDSIVEARRKDFGKKFIVLPNAIYGNWPASLGIKGNQFPADSLLKKMTESFNGACN